MIKVIKLLLISPIFFVIIGCTHHVDREGNSHLNKSLNLGGECYSLNQCFHYQFEGSEPFWRMEIQNENLFLYCSNKEVRTKVSFAEKSANGNTIGFTSKEISGIINESWDHNCCYAVTEEDTLPYEIFFVFEGKTYRGCGKN